MSGVQADCIFDFGTLDQEQVLSVMRNLLMAVHLLAGVLLNLFGATSAAWADQPPITSGQAEQILSELRKIRLLLENSATGSLHGAAPGAPNAPDEKVSVTMRDSDSLGSADAPLTMIEFSDYQCPFCRKFHTTVFDELKKNFIDTGRLRYVSRDLPLPMHENATEAARAARCAGEQREFWEARHVLMTNQQKLKHDDLIGFARDLHLNVESFTQCLDDRKYESAVQQDATDAAEVGVVGTPTFVLGRTQQKGPFTGIKIVGAQPYSVYEAKIRSLLATYSAARSVTKVESAIKKASVNVPNDVAPR